tara:strand:- start:161 stop:370 length:210 start_codon:yes stop_codon:yes gene_type:complete
MKSKYFPNTVSSVNLANTPSILSRKMCIIAKMTKSRWFSKRYIAEIIPAMNERNVKWFAVTPNLISGFM